MPRPRRKTPDEMLAYQREWRAAHPQPREHNAARYRRYNLKRWYGLTVEQYEAMKIEQGGVCAICLRPEWTRSNNKNGGLRDLAVDHNKETGEVRGLLCAGCNVAIGYLRHDPALLAAAIAYLKRDL